MTQLREAGPTAAIGKPVDRLDGPQKVRGAATYAYEHAVEAPAYLALVQATIAAGRVRTIATDAATTAPGVLAVITHENAPRIASTRDTELAVLQSDAVYARGQIIGAVAAETIEDARRAAELIRVDYDERPHDVILRSDRTDLRKPVDAAEGGHGGGELQDFSAADSVLGAVDDALASASIVLDAQFTTPPYFHNPMEPHSTIAAWADDTLTIYCSSQGVHRVRTEIATVFGLDPDRVRVISPHVGGGFGSKVYLHADVAIAVMAARVLGGRPAKLALTRRQMFALAGYRGPTIQRVKLGATPDGRLTAIAHDAVQQTATHKEYCEQVAICSRVMYAAPDRRTTHRVAALDVPYPTIMRAPGESTGMFALESAMDELAVACRLDPIELRIRNEPEVHPESGLPFSSRYLVRCLRDGARRFGWEQRSGGPRYRRDGGWRIGAGVAASTYPCFHLMGNTAKIRAGRDGRYEVRIAAADIGTGTWTALTQIAADALGVWIEDVDLQIGDSNLPVASGAGGSSGITSWGTAICAAADEFRTRLAIEHGGVVPVEGFEVTAEQSANPDVDRLSMHAFGAQFVEVRVHEDTGELRVPRMVGVFDVGRVINPKTARSQLIGGMTMGLSMALYEHGVMDPQFGHVVNGDLAGYHIAANADVGSIDVDWLDEADLHVNPMGSKGMGEVGIVGTAAAVANAVYDATGIRIRDLPITLDKLL